MERNKKKTLMIILGIFALVIVTTAASFAFFTYSRTGNTKATIISGDIEFSYIEGESAELVNAFPVSDEIGAIDESGEYDFQVKLNSTGTTSANYNVYLVDNNTSTNHFTNEQIKFALIKNDVFVANTSATEGVKLSSIDGFDEGTSKGEGIVLEDQEISSGEVDNYKLRIWISDDVTYTNDYQSDGTMEGKYNSYTYSLKVKVTAGLSTYGITNVKVGSNGVITADLSDPNGLSAYAVNTSGLLPEDDEWIEITSDVAKNKSTVLKVNDNTLNVKTITYRAIISNRSYYLYLKNGNNEIIGKEIKVGKIEGENATTKIKGLASTNTNELRVDTHEATGQQTFATTEYRYYGATPNNYIEFNNELWRIIGVFNVDDGNGNVEERLKIIRANSIGNLSWDSSIASINSGRGVNEWNQAALMTLLNEGAYYNRTTGTCYSDINDNTAPCDFTSTGLTSDAKEMIGNAKWYLGAHSASSATTEAMYGYERSIASSKKCSSGTYCTDKVERKTYWVGQIGLMYPSDYGYASDMTSCSNTLLNAYKTSCAATSWLFNSENKQWTLSPLGASAIAHHVFCIDSDGNASSDSAANTIITLPTVYLLSDIIITDGTGTDTDPFIIAK